MLKRASILLIAAVLVAGVPLLAQQRGGGMMGMMPQMNGMWNPVVGSGATYEMTGKDGKKQSITIEIVGKEDSNGQSGFWLEILMSDPKGQQFVIQDLMVKSGDQVTPTRMIIQQAGQPPMEMSMAMMGMMAARGGGPAPTPSSADVHKGAEVVGTESITTPAGAFECEHLRGKDGGNIWLSPKAGPWGFVKAVSADNTSMILVKVITDAKSHVVGTPQSMDSMMGRGRGLE
jgi:hypothetical protein